MTKEKTTKEGRIELTASLAIALLSISYAALYIQASFHGLDFTDEGYYLNWIHDPWQFKGALSYFGYAYHIPYVALGENIASLRIFNILSIFLAASLLGFECQMPRNNFEPYTGILERLCYAVSIACFSLIGIGILTPSYNSLALLGCLLTTLFTLRATRRNSKALSLEALDITLLSLSLVLSGLGKPTTFAGLSLVMTITALVKRGRPRARLLIALLISLLTILPLFVQIGLTGLAFREEIRFSLEALKILGAKHSIAHMLYSNKNLVQDILWKEILLAAIAAASIISILKVSTKKKIRRLLPITILCAALIFTLISASPIFFLAIVSTFACIYPGKPELKAEKKGEIMDNLLVATIILSAPYCYAIGTANDLWTQMSSGIVFLGMCCLAMISSWENGGRLRKAIIPITIAISMLVSHNTIMSIISNPYRQNIPLLDQASETLIGKSSKIKLDQSKSAAIKTLQAKIRRNSESKSISIIDLTGHSPGLIYAVGAKPTGAAWLIGGYKGSEQTAKLYLKSVTESELSNSWVLVEEGGKRSISKSVLNERGNQDNFLSRYALIAEVSFPSYNKNFEPSIVTLYKPKKNT